MKVSEIIRRLNREKRDWNNSENIGPEVRWVVRGIDTAILHVRNIQREQLTQERLRGPHVMSFRAVFLYATIRRALNYLKTCDRARAIAVLERAITLIQGETNVHKA